MSPNDAINLLEEQNTNHLMLSQAVQTILSVSENMSGVLGDIARDRLTAALNEYGHDALGLKDAG